MKKFFKLSTALCLFSMASAVWADASSELRDRLQKIDSFSADFNQTVTAPRGGNVQQGSGKFQLKRPNLFHMDTKRPQETQIIADGKTLWFYDPFVQQVTANFVSEAVYNTPFILLTSNDPSQWEKYTVEQKSDSFTLKPKSKKTKIKQFDVRIDSNGVLKGFSTIEKDGQTNLYVLRNITNQTLPDSLFQFSVPKGVELDDQRNKKKK